MAGTADRYNSSAHIIIVAPLPRQIAKLPADRALTRLTALFTRMYLHH